MRVYLLRRFLAMIPMFFLMTGVFFLIQNYLPGGPVQDAIAQIRGAGGEGGSGRMLSPENIEKLRRDLERQYGLDKPVHTRYVNWVSQVVRLEFGDSLTTRRPAIETIVERFPISLSFGIPGFLLTYLICIPLGVAKALRDGSVFDILTSFKLFVLYSVPPLVIAVVLLLLLGTDRVFPALFPLGGYKSDGYESLSAAGKLFDHARHLFLPVVASLVGGFTVTTLLMKNSVLEVIKSDYIRTARAKGVPESRVVFVHALRNAVLPLMVGLGGFLSAFIAGSLVVERVFGIPGMSSLFIESLEARDYNVMMAVIVLISLVTMLGQLVSDVAYVWVDPRIDFK